MVFGLLGAWAYRLLTFPNWPNPVPRGSPIPGADNIMNMMIKPGQVPLLCSGVQAVVPHGNRGTCLPPLPSLSCAQGARGPEDERVPL